MIARTFSASLAALLAAAPALAECGVEGAGSVRILSNDFLALQILNAEAAACATPIISDVWDGLDTLFEPGREIVLALGQGDVIAALTGADAPAIGDAARARALAAHTATHRAAELESHLREAATRQHTADVEAA